MAHWGFQSAGPLGRPYRCSNLVMGLTGVFRSGSRKAVLAAGKFQGAGRSLADGFPRAHHDGQLIGAKTLREEAGPVARVADCGIDDENASSYREVALLRGRYITFDAAQGGALPQGSPLPHLDSPFHPDRNRQPRFWPSVRALPGSNLP